MKPGYSTGHGFLRSPSNIRTAAALTCIAIQSSQNDGFGGQSIPLLDYYLAPYVAKSLARNIAEYLSIKYDIDKDELKRIFTKKADNIIRETSYEDVAKVESTTDPAYLPRLAIHRLLKEITDKYDISHVSLDKVIDKAKEMTQEDTDQALEALVHNLNTMNSRAGSQTPFSSVNFGTDTTWEGRCVSKSLLKSIDNGLGLHETAIFPISIFRMMKGVTDKGSPNYDLFKESCRVSARRAFPNFENQDAPYNMQYYKGTPETMIATMGMTSKGKLDIRMDNSEKSLDISEFGKFLLDNKACTPLTKFDQHTTYVQLTKKVEVRDTMSPTGWTVVKKWMVCNDPDQKWLEITDSEGNTHQLTTDHPLPIKVDDDGWVRTATEKIVVGDTLAGTDESHSTINEIHVDKIVPISDEAKPKNGFDIETESDRFDLDTIISHNCLSKDSKLILKTPDGQVLFTTADYFRNLGEGISYLDDYEIYTGDGFVKLVNVALRKETDHILRITASHGYIEVTEEQKIPIIRNREEITVRAGDIKPMDVLFWRSFSNALPQEQQLTHINLIDLLAGSQYENLYGITLTPEIVRAFSQLAVAAQPGFIDTLMSSTAITLSLYLEYRTSLMQILDERKLRLLKNKSRHSIPAVYELSEEFGRFFGLFYSEGSVTYDRSVIPVTNSDENIIKFVTDFVGKTWETQAVYQRNRNGCCIVYVNNSTLGSLLTNGILASHHGSACLEIPKWFLYANTDFIKGFLGGVIDGDGSVVPQNYTRIITASQKFATDIQYLAGRIGYRASVSMEHSKGSVATFGDIKCVRNFDNWRVTFDNVDVRDMHLNLSIKAKKLEGFERNKTRMANCPRDYANRVRQIEKVAYDGYVYDFETEDHFIFDNTIRHHQCRTRVISNYFNKDKEIVPGRGNLFWTTISLPYIALEVKEKYPNLPEDKLVDEFLHRLSWVMDEVIDMSYDRFEIIARRKAKNFPFAMGQHEYVGSENLKPDDEIREVIKNGTISLGFIGLSDALIALTGKHHGESEHSQELGLKIVKFMRDRCDKETVDSGMNFSLMATPAEGCTGRLLKCIKKRFGDVPRITDKKYLINSSHVDVRYKISAFKKIDIEAPYHALENAG